MNPLETIYIEDDEQEAFVMRLGMRRQDINILHVRDISEDIVSQLQQPPYDTAAAIMVDAVLPGHNGTELACKLRDSGDNRALILLTAGENPDPELLQKYDIIYIRKPPHFEQLAAMIRHLTNK